MLWTTHATNDLINEIIEIPGILGFRVVQPVVPHLRRDMSERYEFVSNSLPQRLAHIAMATVSSTS